VAGALCVEDEQEPEEEGVGPLLNLAAYLGLVQVFAFVGDKPFAEASTDRWKSVRICSSICS
jgi:hypothetical protein